jgi:aminocarboxymuconate-semialdehyde decarboxylase
MLINLHAHHLSKGMFDVDGHWGPFWTDGRLKVGKWILGTKRPDRAPSLDQLVDMMGGANRIARMDSRGVDRLVLSVPSHLFMYHAGEFGTRYARISNDELAAAVAEYPDRLAFWAHVPLGDPVAAVAELDRAVTELGAIGMSMGGANFGGREAFDPAFDPLWEKVCELGVPVFVHGYNQSVTWGDRAMDDPFDTTSILGMCSDEAKLFWYMVCGGVLDRFPDLRVYITHAGGFVPFQVGRFHETNLTMAPDSKNAKPVLEYMPNFYFDLDLHSPHMRKAIAAEIGVDRLLYGDNFGGADSHAPDLTEGIGLSDADREKIRSGNAIELVKAFSVEPVRS